jgi:hypothetical protein
LASGKRRWSLTGEGGKAGAFLPGEGVLGQEFLEALFRVDLQGVDSGGAREKAPFGGAFHQEVGLPLHAQGLEEALGDGELALAAELGQLHAPSVPKSWVSLLSTHQEGKALESIGLNRLQPQGASASSLAALPVFLVFLFFQRRIVESGVLTGLTG